MMYRKSLFLVYLALAVAGFVSLLFYKFDFFSQAEGMQISLYLQGLMGSSLSSAMAIDFYITALVFSIWVIFEAKRQKIKRSTFYVLMSFTLGLALTLPLFLAVRERALKKKDEADIIKELFKYKYVNKTAKNDGVNKQQNDSIISMGEVV